MICHLTRLINNLAIDEFFDLLNSRINLRSQVSMYFYLSKVNELYFDVLSGKFYFF